MIIFSAWGYLIDYVCVNKAKISKNFNIRDTISEIRLDMIVQVMKDFSKILQNYIGNKDHHLKDILNYLSCQLKFI